MEPPDDSQELWEWWYEDQNGGEGLPPEQRAAVWTVFDKARFYTVEEVSVELEA